MAVPMTKDRSGDEVTDTIRQQVDAHNWYHTMEIVPGVVTNGWFDLRPHVDSYGLPERMDGMRALDIGTWDGFWAFEMERRGATVVALDVDHESEYDWPPRRRPATPVFLDRGAGFRIAKEIKDSKVERVVCNIYDTDPAQLGTFDFVFIGTVLIHLRDQLLALERIAALCHGRFVFADGVRPRRQPAPVPGRSLSRRPRRGGRLWLPGRGTWKRMLWTAGFDEVTEYGRFKVDDPGGQRQEGRHPPRRTACERASAEGPRYGSAGYRLIVHSSLLALLSGVGLCSERFSWRPTALNLGHML